MSWCDDLKKTTKIRIKSFFWPAGNLLAKKHVYFKSKQLKIWIFDNNKKVLSWCDDSKNKKNPKTVIFWPTENYLPKNTFFLNRNRWRYFILVWPIFLSWCDDLRKTRKIRKSNFFGLQEFIRRKIRFLKNQNHWRYEILVKTKKFFHNVTFQKIQKNPKKVIFSAYRKLLAKKHVSFK